MFKHFSRVAVIGAGAMGRGIAQVMAQAGSTVFLYDTSEGAIEDAIQHINKMWEKMASKGNLPAEAVAEHAQRLQPAGSLHALAECDMVVEAIVERLEAKQSVFNQLEAIVGPACVLATNTSSLSVTAIAAALKHPERVVGYHFFNPVPVMKLVEVVAGIKTDPAICERLTEYTKSFGHTPVSASDTPGFIVNHAGRGLTTEALRIVGEQVADFVTVDRIVRDQLGFKIGPFELMDLTALDVSHPVMESIYRQYFDEPRYRPSVITAQRMAGGLLGRKTGGGFYPYADGKAVQAEEPAPPMVTNKPPVWVSPKAARRAELYQLLKDFGVAIETGPAPSEKALILVAPLGLDVTTIAAVDRLDPTRTVGIDMMLDDAATKRRVLATNPATRSDMKAAAHSLFASDGKAVSVIRDSGGFVSQRILGHIINIASDMCQQGICSPKDLDQAVTLALGYPAGPLALGDAVGPASVLEILFNMQTVYGDPRYRPSPWLRRRGALGLSLRHVET